MKYQVVSERRTKYEVTVRAPGDAYSVLKRYGTRKQEHFFCLPLDGIHRIIAVRIVTIGIVNRTIVHPREVFRRAIIDNAAAVIVAHNHPSGSTDPSWEDRDVTRRLMQAGEVLGVRLLDHLIVAREGYYSFREHGEICE